MQLSDTPCALAAAANARPGRKGGRFATAIAAYAFAVTMLATTLPTPLYDLYRHRLGFSELVVTIIFAIYAGGVIASLLLFGRLSDQVGRRPILLTGLTLSATGMMAFVLAHGVILLLTGRLLCGLSAGIFTGTATATLIDLSPPENRRQATLTATVAQMGGLGLGPLLCGLVASSVAAPLRVPFLAVLGMLLLAALGIWTIPEPVPVRRHPQLRPQLLRVPATARGVFITAALAACAGFAVLGLATAMTPAILSEELSLHAPATVGLVVFAVLAGSTAGGLVSMRVGDFAGLRAGCTSMIVGMGILALSLLEASLSLLVIGGVVAGFGQGLSLRSGIDGIAQVTPPRQRAEVNSAFFAIGYAAVSLPVIGVGVLTQFTSLRAAGLLLTALVAVFSAAAIVLISVRSADKPRVVQPRSLQRAAELTADRARTPAQHTSR
jgi:MFS family permease